MLRSLLGWFGFTPSSDDHGHDHGSHGHGKEAGHGHSHGTVDPTITTSAQGLWAVKWSFVLLAITAALQLVGVLVSGSVALFADMIHNVGDAATAIPLGIAFMLARRAPNPRFTYGYGRAEDFAGVAVVLIILASAIVAAYEAIHRLVYPQPITQLGWVAAAGIIGFVGNEVVAIFRIRIGRRINSAALVADGYHARTDGLTSLAVVAGAFGVWLGYPLADPIIGLLITVAIFGIVWQSSKAVLERMLDGVEPRITADIRHAAEHVPGIRQVLDVRARWLGHRLVAELDVALDGSMDLRQVDTLTTEYEKQLSAHVPALSSARIRARPFDPAATIVEIPHSVPMTPHHHAPAPAAIRGELAEGVVEIVDTDKGERLRFSATKAAPELQATISIRREGGRVENLHLSPARGNPSCFMSEAAPEEPHEFTAGLELRSGGRSENIEFVVVEPHGHQGNRS